MHNENNSNSLKPQQYSHMVMNTGLFLSIGCRLNLPAEKEAMADWILEGHHLVKGF